MRVHGKDLSSLTLAAQPLLTDTVALNFTASSDTHDTTTLGDDWKEAVAGLKGGDDITHEMFYDNLVTTGTWAFVTNLLGGTGSALSFGDGVRTVSCSVIVKNVSLPISVADMMKFTATYQVTGAITFA
jgi:hypothetical protein